MDTYESYKTRIKGLRAALTDILDITHNQGRGVSLVLGYEDGTNRIVYTPEQINRIGDLCRTNLPEYAKYSPSIILDGQKEI